MSDADTVNAVSPTQTVVEEEKPFSKHFCHQDNTVHRRRYLKALILGCFLVVIAIWAVFPIYWGSLWKTPERPLKGWIIDFDGGIIGQSLTSQLVPSSGATKVSLTTMPSANYPGGPNDLANAVVQQHTWVAVTINPGASARLEASYANPNSSYNGSEAVSVYAAEARNENAFRVLIRPTVELLLDEAQATFSMQAVRQMASLSPSQLNNLMTNSPQTLTTPIAWTLYNVRPFFEPVASAVTFVGLIYVLILSFFVVMIAYGAREASGLNRVLTLRSLIFTRYASSFAAYFIVSLFYSLVSLAFQINFSIKFGRGGFVVFWMLNWMGMLSVGLALESLITIVTPKFIPFFMILWIIVNVSVCLQPIEVLPLIFRYGYAMPFYNISHAVRCIIFATKNQVGQNFGVLFAWIGISLLSLPLIQWYVRRDDVRMYESQKQAQAQAGKTLTRSSAGFPSASPDSNEKVSIMLKENAGKTAPPQAQPFNANGSREKDGRSSPQTYSGSETAQESVENDSAVQRV